MFFFVLTIIVFCSEDDLVSDYHSSPPEEQDEVEDDLPPGAAAEENPGDLSSVDTDDHSDESRWPVRSAVVTETCLDTLLEVTLVRCNSCGRTSSPTTDRVSMSFTVKWVRKHRLPSGQSFGIVIVVVFFFIAG